MSAEDTKGGDASKSQGLDARAAPPSIPEYELLRSIGRGSYGEVWLARSVTGAYRAVKIVYRRTFVQERPYEREFRGIQKFEPVSRSHDSQVDVLHVGRNDVEGYFYYVMELADDLVDSTQPPPANADWRGYIPRTLRNELNQSNRLTFNEVLEVGIRLATALEHLHRHGLVHRDIKPSNIIFVGGAPKLADIGLVAPQDDSISFVGTLGYLPPEGPGTPQADVYSLGKVLYETSTGKDRREFPDPPTELGTDANLMALAELNEITLKACHRDIEERYQSAQELRADLLLLQSGKSVKHLRKLERRVAIFTRAGIATAAVALLAVGGYLYQKKQTLRLESLARESRERAVRLSVAQGVQRMDNGDNFNSLVWFTEALRLSAGNPEEEAVHRYRIEAVRSHCPKLVAFGVHGGQIVHARFSPHGHQILTAGSDGTARVWDSLTSLPVSPLFQHEGGLRHAAFSPDGRRVATAGDDHSARIWDLATGAPVGKPLPHGSNVLWVAFSQDGGKIATASADQTARIWNVDSGLPVGPPMRHSGFVDFVTFSPDDRWVATASRDHTARIWDGQTGEFVGSTFRHDSDVNLAVFSTDGSRLLTASNDGTSQLWNPVTGAPTMRPFRQRGRVNTAAFSPDGKRILTAGGIIGAVGIVCVWDAATGELIVANDKHERPVLRAEFSPDGKCIATASADWTARVWDAATGVPVSPVFAHNSTVSGAAFSNDGRKVLTVSRDQTWRIWDLQGESSPSMEMDFAQMVWAAQFDRLGLGIMVAERNTNVYVLSTSGIQRTKAIADTPRGAVPADVDSDKRSVDASAENNNNIPVWNGLSVSEIRPWLRYTEFVVKAAFSPDGRFVAKTSDDNTLRVWNMATGDPVSPHLPHEWPIRNSAFSPDGQRIAVADGRAYEPLGEVRIWDIVTGQLLLGPLKHSVAVVGVEFSPDGKRLLTACGDGTENSCSAQIWDLQTGKPTGIVMPHADGVNAAAFSPDGRFVATASEDCTARLWDSYTGAPIGRVMKHKRSVGSAEFSRDGRRIVTASHDGTARIWDARTGEPIAPAFKCPWEVRSAHFSPEGRRVLVASGSHQGGGQIRLWELLKTERAIEDLVHDAEMLSGNRLIATGALVPVSPEELQELWRDSRKDVVSKRP